MRRFILMFMIFLSHLALANAQNIFQYERVDFFGNQDVKKEPLLPETNPFSEIITDEWAEPIITPSGRASIYVPPKKVRDFLDKPTAESAKAYLAWNLKRIKKFILAQELLRKEAKELKDMNEPKSLPESNSPSVLNSLDEQNKRGADYLFYFMLKGCPFCEKESRVIRDIYLNHPEIRIEAFAKGFSDTELESFRFPARQDGGMSNLFKVNTYPSIAVFNKKKEKHFLSGFVDRDSILKLFE